MSHGYRIHLSRRTAEYLLDHRHLYAEKPQ
jgi:hypothetical protein